MADRPILFSAPMVRALLAFTKAHSRRPLYALRKGNFKRQMRAVGIVNYPPPPLSLADAMDHFYDLRRMYAVGDRLWVREAFRFDEAVDRLSPSKCSPAIPIQYQSDGLLHAAGFIRFKPGRLRASMHMPRWASRLTLTVTDVRVQRLQDISEEDAIAEGVTLLPSGRYHCGFDEDGEITCKSPITAYANLWNSINGDGAWMNNPWVVAYSFTVERRNIDAEG